MKLTRIPTLPMVSAVVVSDVKGGATIPDAPAVRPAGRTDQDHKTVTRDRVYHLKCRGQVIDAGADYHKLKAKGNRLFKLGGRHLVIETAEGYELCMWGLLG